MPRIAAFAPGHVTGFFAIHDSGDDPIRKGSRGAGFCTALGVVATVEPSDHDSMVLNGERTVVEVVRTALEFVRARDDDTGLTVSIRTELPIGQGFGMSGAMALAASMAAAEVLGSGADPIAAAHRAEVLQRTGLGDVVAQAAGGFEVRTAAGGPRHGSVTRLDIDPGTISLAVLGPVLPTRMVLSDPGAREAISRSGDSAVDDFIADPTLDRFCLISRAFAISAGLMSPEVASWVARRPRASMSMLGNSAFAFGRVPGAIVTSLGGPAVLRRPT